ncbi:MAG: OmpA family protein [Bacteroidales bacterium]
MKKKVLSIALSLTIGIISYTSIAQTSFTPVNLGPTVNSEYPEINPIMHPNGKILYFSRANHPENTYGGVNSQDIWFSTLNDDGTWTEAQRLPRSVNIGRYNAIFGIFDDGNSFLINGHYSPNGKFWIDRGLSILERTDNDNWGKPSLLNVRAYSRMNKGKTTTAYMTPDKNYLLLSFGKRSSSKNNSIYLSVKKGSNRYSKPKKVRFAGSSLGRSYEAPFLSSDGKALYFSCKVDGNYTLYVSNRTDDSYFKWAVPIPLNDTINSTGWENYWRLNSKENWAYYCSNTNSIGKSDIYRVKIFEDNPNVKLSGLILNKIDEKLMLADTNYRITFNGTEVPNLKIDKASASYEVLLPFGQNYTIKPEMQNWVGVTDTLKAESIKEYTEMNLNLYFDAIPYVKVFGKIINSRNNLPISIENNPKVLVNNLQSDSVKYGTQVAEYSAILPLGAKYIFNASVPNFIGKPDTIDVTSVVSYTEKEIDLYIASVPWIEVKGTALDNNTFTPIIGASNPKLMINGNIADSIAIDPVNGSFTVRLPYGLKYKTAISSKDYITLDNELDLTNYVEYAKLPHNVFAERKDVNMAILSGNIINIKTEKPVTSDVPVKLKVNGVETMGFKYDSVNASYTLKLPVGVSYDILPSVKNFYNKYEQVDLTKVKKGTKIPKNFYVTPIEVGQTVNIDFIYFETGKSKLKPVSFRSLNSLVEFLNEYPNVMVEIGGHTDNVGSVTVNQRISEQRAKSVAEYVISMGVPANRITSKGYSSKKPKVSNATAKGRAQNRRVEFTIIGI